MTHGLLETHQVDISLKDTDKFRQDYSPLGYFYEHRDKTKGHVFLESDLEKFINDHGKDPANVEGHCMDNWAIDDNLLRNRIKTMEILVFPAEHKCPDVPLIVDNYNRYELYEKK